MYLIFHPFCIKLELVGETRKGKIYAVKKTPADYREVISTCDPNRDVEHENATKKQKLNGL